MYENGKLTNLDEKKCLVNFMPKAEKRAIFRWKSAKFWRRHFRNFCIVFKFLGNTRHKECSHHSKRDIFHFRSNQWRGYCVRVSGGGGGWRWGWGGGNNLLMWKRRLAEPDHIFGQSGPEAKITVPRFWRQECNNLVF